MIGVRGNLGASTLALHLAGALGGCAVDTRLFGGLDTLAGTEDHNGPRWSNLNLTAHRIAAGSLLETAPRWWQVPVISGSRLAAASSGDAPRFSVAPIIETLRAATPVVADLALDALDGRDECSLLDEANLTLLIAGRDVLSAVIAKNVAASCGSKKLLVARCHPGMSLAAHDVSVAAGVPLGPVLAHTPKLAQPVECGVGPAVSRPRWDKPGRLTSAAPVPVEVAAARLALVVREHS